MRGIAAVHGSPQPRFVDHPAPRDPGPGEVLCQTLELGICGTDREILHAAEPILPQGDDYLVLGHECLARVEAIGPAPAGSERAPLADGSTRPLEVGDLVVPLVRRAVEPRPERVDFLPFGTYRERGIVAAHGFSVPWWLDRPEYLFRVPRALAPWAVLTEPLAVAEKGINEALVLQQARLGPETWVQRPPRTLVTGPGPIGFAGVLAAVVRGWPTTLYGRDPADSSRAQLARDLGAAYLPASEANFQPDDLQASGYDLVLECTGSEGVLINAARATRASGVIVWLGSSRRPEPTANDLAYIVRDGLLRNHIHLGCVNAAPRDFVDALTHLDQLRQSMPGQLERLVTARVTPDESLWHYEHREPQGIKVVLVYDGV
ncbi:MAG: alcohol dehydrogenase catalytic domain-containing protein [Planctomycetaceae bacterium]|nr:alcohol dehydrogenase catalytic domain-containing protein [Planctomycetaceae bacterium]